MGVDGFLRQLSDAVDRTHLHQFRGQTLAVDALSWLYKACYGCALELSTGKETDQYVQYMLRKVDMMQSCGVATVVLVFDGQRLPLKSLTQEKRQKYKDDNRRRALQAMAVSKRLHGPDRQDEVNKAYQLFQRSVSITPRIISTVITALRGAGISFVVAPFEADAQMVWMCKEGLAAGIVTEDSDVVVYCLTANVSCPVLVKLEDNGTAQAVSRSILYKNSAKTSSNALLRKIHYFTSGEKEATRMFVQVCVLAGCDFIDSLPNIGFVTAAKHIFNFRGAPAHLRVQRLAETIFFHHIIFNPQKRRCEFLVDEKHTNCFPDILQRAKESLGITSTDEVGLMSNTQQKDLHAVATATESFFGKVMPHEIIEQIYKGEVCARTLCIRSDSPTSSQKQESYTGSQDGQSLTASREARSKCNGHSYKSSQGFSTMVKQSALRQFSPIAAARQTEIKKCSQANTRAVSLQTLVSVYKTPTVAAKIATDETPKWSTSTVRTRETDLRHFDGGTNDLKANVLEASTSNQSSIVSKVKASKATAMKDLIAMYSPSVQAPKSPNVPKSLPKVAPQRAPESRKRPQPATKSVVDSSKKVRTLGHQSIREGSQPTLFDFFQKQ